MQNDYSTWLTKQQAADAIGCSTKTVEQFAKERKIQQAIWRRPEGGARISVYHPDDVERIRKERNPDAPPFVMPPDSQTSQRPETAMIAARSGDSQNSQSGVAMLAKMLEHISSQNSENRWPPPLFLTTDEAVRYSGLSATFLNRLVTEGKLKRISEGLRGHRYRRADLDNLNL